MYNTAWRGPEQTFTSLQSDVASHDDLLLDVDLAESQAAGACESY
jgi:hypothetical protein